MNVEDLMLGSLEDLKLLADVAYHERHGQRGFTVGRGFGNAKNRLLRAGHIVQNPSCETQVTLTRTGEATIARMLGGPR